MLIYGSSRDCFSNCLITMVDCRSDTSLKGPFKPKNWNSSVFFPKKDKKFFRYFIKKLEWSPKLPS